MRIRILQNNLTIGAVEQNYAKLEAQIRQDVGADLFITSELALVGYPARDLLSQKSLIEREQLALGQLQRLSAELKVGILVGHTEPRVGFLGKPLFNSASLFDCGQLIGRVRKHRVPAYDIFEEERFFEKWTGDVQGPLVFRGQRLGIAICEDGWESIRAFGFRDVRSYPKIDPATVQEVDLYINLSASPYGLKKRINREDLFCAQAARAQRPLIYANACGAQDDLIFDGASFAVAADGKICAQAALFGEDSLRIDWDENGFQSEQADSSAPKDFQLWEELRRALVSGLKDFVHKSKSKKVLLGLSGGIDSALCAALAVEALGPDQVTGVSLPSALTSQLSKDLARQSATALGIEFREISIASAVAEHQKLLGLASTGVAFENLQSRNRGLLLMGIANSEGHFLLATGNKSELAMGYSTLYGDMCGALCPLGDLYKTEVYGLSHYLNHQARQNQKAAPIPDLTLSRPPTAELAPGQKDNDSLPNYEVLDGILYELIENQGQSVFSEESWNKILAPKHSVTSLRKKIFAQEFKRYQSSPILKIHQRAFGSGWHMPLTKEYP